MRTARNVAIVMVLALGVAFAPAGGNVVDTVFTALTMGFLAGIAWMLYTLSRQNQLTLATLNDRRRLIFYAAFGVIALLIAGTDKLFSSGSGTVVWIFLLAVSVAAILRIWREANTY
jgi:Sec-independent protein secretion pathway component TatC